MLHINRKQRKFLLHISKASNVSYSDMSDSQIKIANFLEENNLIDVKYEIIQRYDFPCVSPRHERGERLSASISEAGKAYLSERKYELTKMLLHDCFWPFIVSVATNLAITGIRLLLPLIRQWLSSVL